MKKTISLFLGLIMVFGCFFMFSGCGKKDDENTFTFWIPTGVGSEYYTDYSDNPIVDYLEKKFDITLKFITPISGKEIDNFNTLIGTGDYPDVMDLSFYNGVGSVSTLYEDDIALNISDHVNDSMPNYKKFLNENPDVGLTAKNEGKFLQLYSFHAQLPQNWGGFVYRRDWIAKYGKFPAGHAKAGQNFTQNYNRQNISDYSDDVIFPSGNIDPTTIADWEWMLDIFKNIPDCKYPMSLPYRGFFETGDLVTSFGTGVYWNMDTDGSTIKFGGASNEMRAYFEKMNQWYKAGYIDPSFDTRAQDLFYEIDINTVYQGKVGLWYGLSSQFLNRMQASTSPATTDIMVYACNSPLTSSGGAPTVFYQSSKISSNYVITEKAAKKNIDKLIAALDWMYSDEAMIMKTFGLNKEQYEFCENAFMKNRGFTDGTYTIGDDGLYYIDPVVKNDSGRLREALTASRLPGLENLPLEGRNETAAEDHSYYMWTKYIASGNLSIALTGQTTDAQAKTISQAQNSIRDYMEIEGAKLVKNGVTNSSWDAFCKKLKGYKYEDATAIYQSIVDALYNN